MYTTYFDDMFEMMNRLFDDSHEQKAVVNTGLRSLIKRPHNLFTFKDENGNVIKHQIQMVYTPFKKEDISLRVDKRILSVSIASKSEPDKKMEDAIVYRGISAQSTSFGFKLADCIDDEHISAHCEEGILYIDLPVKKDETSRTIEVKID